MSQYLVVARHTPEQCLQNLDAVMSKSKEELARWEWGCNSGDHTGYYRTSASSEAEALRYVTENLRSQARAVKLEKFTPEQIMSYHAMKK
jgi:hypothetical protein